MATMLKRILLLCCVLAAAPALGAGCQLILTAEWPVKLERNHAVIDGTINGQPVGILINTGASMTVIARSAAERLKLDRVDSRVQFYGIGGRSRGELTEIEEFRLGDAVLRNWRVLVVGEQPMDDMSVHVRREEPGSLAMRSPETPEMVLGMDFLLAHRVFVSHTQRAVYFTHNGRAPVFDNKPGPTCSERAAGKAASPSR